MRVNPYVEPLLQNVTGLVNDPVSAPEELDQRWHCHGMPTPAPAGYADLSAVREFLTQWEHVVDADTASDRVAILNVLLRRHTAPPSITDHDGSGWHLHYRDPDAGFAATLAGATTAAAAQYLTDRGMDRLGRCAAPNCNRVFVDFSRPGRQRYCCHTCANRDAVRRHRLGCSTAGP